MSENRLPKTAMVAINVSGGPMLHTTKKVLRNHCFGFFLSVAEIWCPTFLNPTNMYPHFWICTKYTTPKSKDRNIWEPHAPNAYFCSFRWKAKSIEEPARSLRTLKKDMFWKKTNWQPSTFKKSQRETIIVTHLEISATETCRLCGEATACMHICLYIYMWLFIYI